MENDDETNKKSDAEDNSSFEKGDIGLTESKPIIGSKKIKKVFLGMNTLIIVLVIVLMAFAGTMAFWWRDSLANDFETKQSKQITSLQEAIIELGNQLKDEKAKNSDSADGDEECTAVAPSESAAENIKAAVNTGNTQPLEGYMAATVNVILAASEAYGPQTPTQAALDISNFLPDPTNTTWNFDLSASVLSSYGSGGYGSYFPNIAIVGKSSDNKVISFSFDCNGKISTVFMASNENELQ